MLIFVHGLHFVLIQIIKSNTKNELTHKRFKRTLQNTTCKFLGFTFCFDPNYKNIKNELTHKRFKRMLFIGQNTTCAFLG